MSANAADPSAVERPEGLADHPAPAAYVSDLLVDLLTELGCRYLPLNPGSSFRGLHDSVVNHGANARPQLLLCLHEEIAVAVAHGYAKATGQVGFAAVHDLVGLMHASMAVYDAWCDRVPLVLLGGGGPLDATRRRPVDWLHSATSQAELIRQYTKYDDEPTSAQALVDGITRARQIAATQPTGPTYVTLDADLQEAALVDPVALPDLARHRPPGPVAAAGGEIARAVDLLAEASFPVIVAGGVGLHADATAPLVRLAEMLGAACVDDRNTVVFPTAHPQNLTGDASVLQEADVILAVDVRDVAAALGRGRDRSRSATEVGATAGPEIIDLSLNQLAVRSWSHAGGAPVPTDVALLADPRHGVDQLLDALSRSSSVRDRLRPHERDGDLLDTWAERRLRLGQRHDQLLAAQRRAARARWDDTPISPARLVAEVWEAVRERPWLLALRNTRTWPHGIWQFDGGGQYLGHSGGGGVGYGPGAMVGAALAARDRGQLAVAIIGDGDLLMAPGALWTAVHYEIGLLVVVNNNRSFYNDEQHQVQVAEQRGRPVANAWIGMRLTDPAVDLAAMARSYGALAEGPITDPTALPGALARALGAVDDGQVALLDVHTAPT
ncbi:MAG: thiamine pyrophosphate-binding protein [Actinomycetota bacterium]|nr:thiamine pyrophosphate-binding protein [Actinomycetota bacterium]